MAGRFDSKVVLVTGGGSGIGRATALAFAQEGAKVIVADINVEGGEETVRTILEAEGEAHFVQTDVSRTDDVQMMVNTTVETYGRLDCAFNNAGIAGPLDIAPDDYPEDVWDKMISINLTGVWLCMKYEVRQMLKQGAGAIVNTASVAGLVGIQNQAYTATKHGVVGLTKAAALSYSKAGVRVNAVCLGYIHTPLTEPIFRDPDVEARVAGQNPTGRLGETHEVAAAVIWLCSDAASYVTGHAMSIDGGYLAY